VDDHLALDGWQFRVEEMAGTRVVRVRLTRNEAAAGGNELRVHEANLLVA